LRLQLTPPHWQGRFPDCCLYLKRTTRAQLKAHLQEACGKVIPGLHKSVVANPSRPTDEICCMVEGGVAFREPFLSHEEQRRVARGQQPACYASAEAYRDDCLFLRAVSRPEQIRYLIHSKGLGSASFLPGLVEYIKTQLSTQTYAEFKALFDAQYSRA
jgi:hypothetical protein